MPANRADVMAILEAAFNMGPVMGLIEARLQHEADNGACRRLP
jgi:hypothetical protein